MAILRIYLILRIWIPRALLEHGFFSFFFLLLVFIVYIYHSTMGRGIDIILHGLAFFSCLWSFGLTNHGSESLDSICLLLYIMEAS